MNRPMHPSNAYLRLAEGPEDLIGSQLSLTRRLLTFFVALVMFSGTSLFATAALDLDHGLIGKALATTGKASHDGNTDSSVGQRPAKVKADDSGSDENHDGDTDSSHGRQLTDSGSDENHNGNTDSSGHGKRAQLTDSGTDDNHDGNTDSGERGERHRR